MKILGIDYGRKKVGLALAEGFLAEPYLVIANKSQDQLVKKILKISEEEDIEKIVVGVSEGKMAQESREFGKTLLKIGKIPVCFWDETLTTKEAQRLSRESGMKRTKRRLMEDAYSATIMLQWYLDRNV